jgi:hypothetical protein
MVDSEHRTGHALELAGSATLATARPRIALAAVAKPAAEAAGLLLVEVLGNPRARAAALGLARSLARLFASRRPPAWAGVEMAPPTIGNPGQQGTTAVSERPARQRRPAGRRTAATLQKAL